MREWRRSAAAESRFAGRDFGWGQANDRNLAGRFSTQTFTVPRLAAVQNYFLRQYDASMPPRYSRYTTALHLNYPA